jgi:aspartyl-tRNA(Asn)/glutamyl-tRNA(Gln) amidotransferase subunit C
MYKLETPSKHLYVIMFNILENQVLIGMKLSRKEVQHIALLARLGLSEEEIEKFRIQLSDILGNFEVLKQLDTDEVPPTAQSIALQNIFRPDEPKPSYPTEEIMGNAPQREGNCFKVNAVLE